MGDGNVRNVALIIDTQRGRFRRSLSEVFEMAGEKYSKEGYELFDTVYDRYERRTYGSHHFRPTVEGVGELFENLNIDNDDNLVIFTNGSGLRDMFVNCNYYRSSDGEKEVCEQNREGINLELLYQLFSRPHGKISMITVNPESSGWGSRFVKDPATLWINQSAKYDTWMAVKKDWLKLESADPVLKKDRDIVIAAIKQNGLALQHAGPSLRKDRSIVMAAVKQNGLALQYADPSLRKDRQIVMAAVKQTVTALQYADPLLFEDREFVLECVKVNGGSFKYAHPLLRKDPKFVLKALNLDCRRRDIDLRDIDPALFKDPNFVLNAMDIMDIIVDRQRHEVAKLADKALWSNRKFVMEAVQLNGDLLKYADERLRGDRRVVFTAMDNEDSAWEHASPSLWKNRGFALDIAGVHLEALKYVNPSLLKDRSFGLTLVQRNGSAISSLDEKLQRDRGIVLAAVKQNAKVFEDFESFWGDRAIVLAAVRQDGRLLQYAPLSLRSNPQVVSTALKAAMNKDHIESLDDVWEHVGPSLSYNNKFRRLIGRMAEKIEKANQRRREGYADY